MVSVKPYSYHLLALEYLALEYLASAGTKCTYEDENKGKQKYIIDKHFLVSTILLNWIQIQAISAAAFCYLD